MVVNVVNFLANLVKKLLKLVLLYNKITWDKQLFFNVFLLYHYKVPSLNKYRQGKKCRYSFDLNNQINMDISRTTTNILRVTFLHLTSMFILEWLSHGKLHSLHMSLICLHFLTHILATYCTFPAIEVLCLLTMQSSISIFFGLY